MQNIIAACFAGFGLWSIFSGIIDAPTKKIKKSLYKSEKSFINKMFDKFLLPLTLTLAKKIKLPKIQKTELANTLRIAGIDISPELYIMQAVVSSAALFLILCLLVLINPMVILFAAIIAVYFCRDQLSYANRVIEKKRQDIEKSLPHLTSIISNSLKINRDVYGILNSYKEICDMSFADELTITLADMKTGSYEAGLIKLATRVNSTQLSRVIRGLLAVVRGEEQTVYFDILHNDLVKNEKELARKKIQLRPMKLSPYSLVLMVLCALFFLFPMGNQILEDIMPLFS